MLLKNVLYINFLDFFTFFGLAISTWHLMMSFQFRLKFVYFLFNLLFFSIWGFSNSWDGWICLFLLSELLIILLFLLSWITFKTNPQNFKCSKFIKKSYFLTCFLLYILVTPYSYSNFLYLYQILYWYTFSIISSDFYLMFKFFFLDYPITVFYITLILSLISIFFICFYLMLKTAQNFKKNNINNYNILRKQQMLKQALFKSQLTTFQIKLSVVPKK